MPYDALSELPDAVRKLPKHAQEIYMGAFNSAFKQYDGDEGKAHGTAWAAVKMKYEQDADGNWTAKETKEVKMATKLSDKNRSNLLQTALVSEYGIGVETPKPKSISVEEVFDDKVIYNIDGQLYEAAYELGDNGTPTFSNPVKVTSTKIFKPMETLQITYSDIIQEAGKRNATLDAARVKKIVELCQELLSSEEPQEKRAKEALKEATSVLKWLKEQESVKTEDSVQFPASAYAYTPDLNNPASWCLRLWESLDKKVTRKQLKVASAYLSEGGFSGKRLTIPSADLPIVKMKIRAEYRNLEVTEEDIPKWVKETMTREYPRSYIPLTEATFDKGKATVIIIKPGFNATEDRYYPAEMLKRDYKIFEGQKMFADHPTETEEKELPERSIRSSWVAVLKDVKVDEAGVVTGVADIIEDWLMKKLASLRDKGMLSEMGISINAIGHATKATIDGKETLVIEELTDARSVDFVTEPGAGGEVTLYEANRNNDIDLIDLTGLKEKRPDLVKLIEVEVRNEITEEAKRHMEDKERITELEGQNETLTTENTSLKDKITEAEKEKAKAEAQATIKEAVEKAELPVAAKEVLIKRFENAESADGIEEAIQSEVEYIARPSESVKVRGLGQSKPDTEKDKEALKESFKKLHPEYTDEQLEVAVTGR